MQALRRLCDDNDDDATTTMMQYAMTWRWQWYMIRYHVWLDDTPLHCFLHTLSHSTSLFAYVILYDGSKLCWLLSWDLWLPLCWGLTTTQDHISYPTQTRCSSPLYPHRRWNSSTSIATSLFNCWVINMNCSWFILQGYEARGEGQRAERWAAMWT